MKTIFSEKELAMSAEQIENVVKIEKAKAFSEREIKNPAEWARRLHNAQGGISQSQEKKV